MLQTKNGNWLFSFEEIVNGSKPHGDKWIPMAIGNLNNSGDLKKIRISVINMWHDNTPAFLPLWNISQPKPQVW